MYDDIYTNLSDSLTHFVNAQQLQVDLPFQSLNDLSVSMQESICNISTHLNQVIMDDWIDRLTAVYDSISQSQLYITDWMDQLSAVYDSMSHVIEFPSISIDALSILKNIDLQEEYIDLTDDDCDLINTILQSPNSSDDALPKVSKGKISVTDFIKTILIPILAILLPMLLTIYYHKIDSIESQKQHIEELQQKKKELQLKEEELHIKEQQLQNDIEQKELLENIFIEAQSFSEYLESLQEDSEYPSAIPEPFAGAPHSPDGTQDND